MSADGSLPIVIEHEASPRANGLDKVRVVADFIPVLDTARFEHMQRIASVMAATSLVPESLQGRTSQQTVANCFLVVNQATRWGMDPFAVAQCCSVVHGKLTYEGKLVAAVIEAKLGVRLRYRWSGEGEAMAIEVSGTLPDGAVESIEGTVPAWKTTGKGTPWSPATYKKMLAYRGAREWARLYAPAVMLGVYSDDELTDLTRRPMVEVNARPLPPSPPPTPQIGVVTAAPAAASPAAQPSAPPRRAGPPPAPKPPAAPSGSSVQAPPVAQRPAEPPRAEPQRLHAPDAGRHLKAPEIDAEALLAHVAEELDCCGDISTLDETWGGFEELIGRLARSDRERANGLYEAAASRCRP